MTELLFLELTHIKGLNTQVLYSVLSSSFCLRHYLFLHHLLTVLHCPVSYDALLIFGSPFFFQLYSPWKYTFVLYFSLSLSLSLSLSQLHHIFLFSFNCHYFNLFFNLPFSISLYFSLFFELSSFYFFIFYLPSSLSLFHIPPTLIIFLSYIFPSLSLFFDLLFF